MFQHLTANSPPRNLLRIDFFGQHFSAGPHDEVVERCVYIWIEQDEHSRLDDEPPEEYS